MKQTPHKLTDKELSALIVLTKKIQKVAKKKGIEMSKRQAKHLAVYKLGFVDTQDFQEREKEYALQDKFVEGVKTALPKYRNL